MSGSVHDRNLYKWRRFSKPQTAKNRGANKVKESDIRTWLGKVEAATDSALRTVFNNTGSVTDRPFHVSKSRHGYSHCEDDEDVLHVLTDVNGNEDARNEAQELVSNWTNEKIRYDFLEFDQVDNGNKDIQDKRGDAGTILGCQSTAEEDWYQDGDSFINRYLDSAKNISSLKSSFHSPVSCQDDALGQLNIYTDDEGTVVDALMKNMVQKPLIKLSEIRALEQNEIQSNMKRTVKFRDPTVTMQMRQKELKEARISRQVQGEKRRLELKRQKEAKFQARQILKEEKIKKKLQEKQEEDAIQVEMARLRKEMTEQRKREEKQWREDAREVVKVKRQEEGRVARKQEMERKEWRRQNNVTLIEVSLAEEEENRVAKVMTLRNAKNRRLIKTCFSQWCKIVLNQRIKAGKAKAMSDWKCIHRMWAIWKTYTRNQKLDKETSRHQASVREAQLKEKRAVNYQRFKLLKKSLYTWKAFVRIEQERREIAKQQESTKAKMQALLNAVASGNSSKESKASSATLTSVIYKAAISSIRPEPQKLNVNKSFKEKDFATFQNPGLPKEAWQVTKKDIHRLNLKQTRIPSSVSSPANHTGYALHQNRNKFQKELIEQQRMLLQDQKRMIEEMQEQQRLTSLQQEVSMWRDQQKELQNSSVTKEPFYPRATPRVAVVKKHPIVFKMEQRGAERTKRKKELQEMKRIKEEQKIKEIKEEERKKQREEEEKKMKNLQERREAKRLQKKLEREKIALQEHMRKLCRMADNHHTFSLMKHHGFLPWKKLIEAMRRKHKVATFHYRTVLLRKALLEWKTESYLVRDDREQKADALYLTLLLRQSMRSWKKYGERMEMLERKAIVHCNSVMKWHHFKYWMDYVTDEKLAEWGKESCAEEHNRLRLLRRVFTVLFSYQKLMKREVDRHQRLDEMRCKVTKLLPDFQIVTDPFKSNES